MDVALDVLLLPAPGLGLAPRCSGLGLRQALSPVAWISSTEHWGLSSQKPSHPRRCGLWQG